MLPHQVTAAREATSYHGFMKQTWITGNRREAGRAVPWAHHTRISLLSLLGTTAKLPEGEPMPTQALWITGY